MATILSNTPDMIVFVIFGKTIICNYENNNVTCQIVLQPEKNNYITLTLDSQQVCDSAKAAIAWYNSPSPRTLLNQTFLSSKMLQYKDVNGQISISGVHLAPDINRIRGGAGATEDNSIWPAYQTVITWLASHGIT